ncbi:MAG: hypothetical protein HC844_17395, partial [Tabrizicola sp.]|nr:hypothetical protein [Tabrizicola sp.]
MARGAILGLALSSLAVLPLRVAAETPMTADEFDAFSTGHTLDYYVDGDYWGSEMHFPGRKVRDADLGGTCRDGRWFPKGPEICFVYESDPTEHCWTFSRHEGGVIARATTTDTASDVSCRMRRSLARGLTWGSEIGGAEIGGGWPRPRPHPFRPKAGRHRAER